jgi:LysR substrate binding domain
MLPDVLAQFAALYRLVQMEVRIEGNAALVDAVDKGDLDLALAVGHADRPTAETIGALDLVWIAGRDHAPPARRPLPLVLLGPQCAFRKVAIARLDEAGVAWRLAAVSPSLSGLWASALGGLGVTARSAIGLPRGLIWRPRLFGLPALGAFPVTLHTRRPLAGAAVDRLSAIVRAVANAALPQTRSATARGARRKSARSHRPRPARAN